MRLAPGWCFAICPRSSMGGGLAIFALFALLSAVAYPAHAQQSANTLLTTHRQTTALFQVSERCFPCHNGMKTDAGEDASIGLEWGASLMANSSRDPYWQASVRRETIDHPTAQREIQNECAICHMPMTTYSAREANTPGEVFGYLPFAEQKSSTDFAQDGVSCSVCHQITPQNLGTPASFNGGFHIEPPTATAVHPEYGPFDVTGGHMHVMRTSSGGFQPDIGPQIRSAELCATCHTLTTEARGSGGKVIGALHEQTPYQEWLHSDYRGQRTCQSCHMPEVPDGTAISSVLGVRRTGARHHVFVAADFFMLRMLGRYADQLAVVAPPGNLAMAADRTVAYLGAAAAQLRIAPIQLHAGRIETDIEVINLGGHKLPTAFPSRRAWLHVVVRDGSDHVVFESGALNSDGSIRGNHNDIDPATFEPHYSEIRSPEQVQIYESILGDSEGRVTTGLLTATHYLKDNRVLPQGFDKASAPAEIAVVGPAATDDGFRGGGHRIRYSIEVGQSLGPFRMEAELEYQPIGYRWAHNLEPYDTFETRRFSGYFASMSSESAVVLARATLSGGQSAINKPTNTPTLTPIATADQGRRCVNRFTEAAVRRACWYRYRALAKKELPN